jgi:uncharacterized protein with HEPN domain
MRQAAADACTFAEGMGQADFLDDKRTQQAVVISLIVIGEAIAKVMDSHADFALAHAHMGWRGMRNRIAEVPGTTAAPAARRRFPFEIRT